MLRLDWVNNGAILKHFPKEGNLHYQTENGKPFFAILSNQLIDYSFNSGDRKITVMSYEVALPNQSYGGLYSFVWREYEACLKYALRFSAESENSYLVVQCLAIVDRH